MASLYKRFLGHLSVPRRLGCFSFACRKKSTDSDVQKTIRLFRFEKQRVCESPSYYHGQGSRGRMKNNLAVFGSCIVSMLELEAK